MSKRYGEPIEVHASGGAITAFQWRGKRYQVRQVLSRWRETGGWWERSADTEKPWLASDAREIVRLAAVGASTGIQQGIYEIACDLRAGAWTMLRILD